MKDDKLKYVYIEAVKRKVNQSLLDVRSGLFSGIHTKFSIDFICLKEKNNTERSVALNIDEYDIIMIEILEDQWKNMLLFSRSDNDQKEAHNILNKTMEVLSDEGLCEIKSVDNSKFYNCDVNVSNYDITYIGDKFSIYSGSETTVYGGYDTKLKRRQKTEIERNQDNNNNNSNNTYKTIGVMPPPALPQPPKKIEKGPTFIKRISEIDKELIDTLYNQLKAF